MRRAVLAAALACGCGRVEFDIRALDADAAPAVRATLRLDRFDPGTALDDFPLLVVLDDIRADRARMRPDALDLRFRDDRANPIAHEVEQLGEVGGAPLIAWVRVPRFAGATTTIEMEYGSGAVLDTVGTVWSDAFAAVWHLTDASAPRDATTGEHHGVAAGVSPIAGRIGGAASFTSTAQSAIRIEPSASLAMAQLTASAWIWQRSRPSMFGGIVGRPLGSAGYNDFYLAERNGTVYGGAANGGLAEVEVATGPLPLATWTHVALVIDAATVRVYSNAGAPAALPSLGDVHVSIEALYLGADCNQAPVMCPDDDFLDGLLDEVRLERVARSDAWLAADHASQLDQVISYE